MSPIRTPALVAMAAVAVNAFAQQAAPAAPAPGAVPKHNCVGPGPHPGSLATDNQINDWSKAATAYLDCLRKFVNEQQGIAKPLMDEAKPHIDAANKAIEEHNAAVRDLRAEEEAAMKH